MSENKVMNYILQSTLNELRSRLEHLRTVELPRITEEKNIAYKEGGTHENAGWDDAIHKEGLLLAEINWIENRIVDAIIIDNLDVDTSKVGIGTLVKIKDLETDEVSQFLVVGSNERGKVQTDVELLSFQAPLGQVMLNKKRGEKFDLKLGDGQVITYKILAIEEYFSKPS
jgi:transcription elongation factor GreA